MKKLLAAIFLVLLTTSLICLGIQAETKEETTPSLENSYTSDQEYIAAMAPIVDYNEPKYYTEEDILLLARTAYCEGRGIPSKMELACVMWTVLNRVDCDWQNDFKDKNTIKEVVLQPKQFAYSESAPLVTDYGYDLYELAQDVLDRWSREKNGDPDPGRVLPKEYLWYASKGDGHNYFRTVYRGSNIVYWDYSLPNPYET